MILQKKQYIGPDKVIGLVKIEDYKTPSGGEVIKVLFEGKESQIMTLKAFESFVSQKPVKDTDFRLAKFEIMSTEVMNILLEYDIKQVDLTTFFQFNAERVLDSFERATNMAWTAADSIYTPGIDVMNNRTIVEADILQKGLRLNYNNESKKDKEGNNA